MALNVLRKLRQSSKMPCHINTPLSALVKHTYLCTTTPYAGLTPLCTAAIPSVKFSYPFPGIKNPASLIIPLNSS